MNTHVLIVDARTFKLHLEYLFVGTGSKDCVVDFNNRKQSSLHPSTEIMLAGMIADGSRMRKGDKIIFYMQAAGEYEGKFFGVFQALDNGVFVDNNDSGQFIKEKLGKSLTFRALIAPMDIYPEGVTEWEALDEIKNIRSPNQMLWSLIYRKLKGNRGNTMITMYESERLIQLIRNKNKRRSLNCAGKCLSFDAEKQKIIAVAGNYPYTGRKESINLLPRLIEKFTQGKAFEAHLQAYITQHIGLGHNPSLDMEILENSQIEWLGNEVSCGVGMQRIDLLVSMQKTGTKILAPIEIKSVEAGADNIRQIQRYVEWIRQYYIPNQPSDIHPALLTRATMDKTQKTHQEFISEAHVFNAKNDIDCAPLKLVEFFVGANNVLFKRVKYL